MATALTIVLLHLMVIMDQLTFQPLLLPIATSVPWLVLRLALSFSDCFLFQSIASVTQMGRRLVDSIMIRDEDIQRVKGIDAVQYLMFQRYILLFLTFLSAVCLLVILPINLQGTFCKLFASCQ